jgi:hypothetical protein
VIHRKEGSRVTMTAASNPRLQPIQDLGREPLLDEYQAAERLCLSVKTLRRWRWLRRGVPWIRVGAAVRYAPDDIAAFIKANRQEIPEPSRGVVR